MHSEKDTKQSHDPKNNPDSESTKGGGDVIAKGGGVITAKKSKPKPRSGRGKEKAEEGETVRTPTDIDPILSK
jgi:hypothetical protein